MTAEEARNLTVKHLEEESINYDMESIYSSIDYDIKTAVERGNYECVSSVIGKDKPWAQIYKERKMIENHYKSLGYAVECIGYNKFCMWDSYRISW